MPSAVKAASAVVEVVPDVVDVVDEAAVPQPECAVPPHWSGQSELNGRQQVLSPVFS